MNCISLPAWMAFVCSSSLFFFLFSPFSFAWFSMVLREGRGGRDSVIWTGLLMIFRGSATSFKLQALRSSSSSHDAFSRSSSFLFSFSQGSRLRQCVAPLWHVACMSTVLCMGSKTTPLLPYRWFSPTLAHQEQTTEAQAIRLYPDAYQTIDGCKSPCAKIPTPFHSDIKSTVILDV